MRDLFRRLKSWLQKFEDPEYEEEIEKKREGRDDYSPAVNKDLSIRTARIYPKDNAFRFPLIPDEQASQLPPSRPVIADKPENRREGRKASNVIRTVETSRNTAAAGSVAPIAKPRSEEKKPFRPTEVISPIYGYKRPEPTEKIEEERVPEPVPKPAPVNLVEQLTVYPSQPANEPQVEWEEEKPDWFLAGLETSAVARKTEQDQVYEAEPIIIKREESREQKVIETNLNPPLVEVRQQKQYERDIERPDMLSSHATQISPVEEKPALQPERTAIYPAGEQAKNLPVQDYNREQAGGSRLDNGFYGRPSTTLLHPALAVKKEKTDFVNSQQELLAVTLQNFNVNAEVIGAVQGPTVTRYEIQPAPGVKVNKITNLVDDIKLSLAARDIRIEAPIPGRSAVGIEVPNEESVPVYLRGIFESAAFRNNSSPLAVALGLDIGGEPVIADLSKMPHGLIAGATGSGKSVCINSIIVSLLYKASPDEVRLLLIDPKMVELAPYNRLPHLVAPVVTDPKQATAALKWAVGEMDRRYEKFAEAGARDISRYNELMRRSYPDIKEYILPTIVIIIDELADLMMVAPGDVEECICRIAQKARACGIHLLVATQRPSVDVITGLIKANIPTRIAFSVSSQTDSRTILDMNGAERLLGRGDMLYLSSGSSKPVRLQGPYVSDEEIEAVTDFVKSQAEPNYLFEKEDLNQIVAADQSDELFAEAVLFCVENGQASASSLQRNFHIGYNRAARLIDMMTDRGFISGQSGSKARDVFLTQSEYQEIFQNESRI